MLETIESAIGIRVIGDSSDAEEWVAESTLDEGTKASLLPTVAAFVERLKQGDVEFSTRFQEDAWGCRFLGDGRFERWSQNYMEGRDEREELDEAGVLALFSHYSAQTLHAGLIQRRSRQ